MTADDQILADVMYRLLARYANGIGYTVAGMGCASVEFPAAGLMVTAPELEVLLRTARDLPSAVR